MLGRPRSTGVLSHAIAGLLALGMLAAAPPGIGAAAASPLAEAMALCKEADRAPAMEKRALLERASTAGASVTAPPEG